jgi:hypothetical protein
MTVMEAQISSKARVNRAFALCASARIGQLFREKIMRMVRVSE